MKTRVVLVLLPFMVIGLSAVGDDANEQLPISCGVHGGLIVHLGCGDGRLTAALGASDRYLVHGLDVDADRVEQAREHIRSLGLYGRVSADTFDGEHLPYTDNLVNLVVSEDLGRVPMDEVMRVLAPLGVAMIAGKRTVKPYPLEMDQWPQYLRDADNNAVAQDSLVGPPRHLQWVGYPKASRSHMAIPSVVSMVSAQGRLFSIEDRGTPEHPFLPGRFKLVARSAFNGLVLWSLDFPDWEPITRYVKDIAMQLQRRLAAIEDVVYCTPGLHAPITKFDASTGELLKVYEGTEQTQEFAYDRGLLLAVVGDRMNAARYNIVKTIPSKGTSLGGADPRAPFDGTGFWGAYAVESQDKTDPVCSIVAIDAETGNQLWRVNDIVRYTGCSLAAKASYVVYQTGEGLFCLDRTTGDRIWNVDKTIESGDGTSANTLILTDDSVYAQEGKTLVAYAVQDGTQKWSGPIANNYEKSADLFFAAGTVWIGGTKQPTSLDPETGERLKTIPQQMTGPMGHDRCYRNFITERYFINSKTGGADFLDLASGIEFPNHWTRGTCGMGVLPCNGMLYAPPYSCQCSIGAMIKGFVAMTTMPGLERPDQAIPIESNVRLVKGPAFGRVPAFSASTDSQKRPRLAPAAHKRAAAETGGAAGAEKRPRLAPTAHKRSATEAGGAAGASEDWPAYRHDGKRGGTTKTKVGAELKTLWKTSLGSSPSAPVIAAGRLFAAAVDAHTLHALDAADGRMLWQYTAGGRIDSPPTCYRGLVLFGSRDGWVHCLRAADGQLVWRFKDLPDRLIGAYGQLESAWPVNGSLLVLDNTLYFAAGRSSFLDGGIMLYGLDPESGQLRYRRQLYGPFDDQSGFPAVRQQGCKADVLVTDGRRLYMRHKAFHADLSDADSAGSHILPSAGFLDANPQHRTYWTIAAGFGGFTTVKGPSGDILVQDGKDFYEVRGFPVHRHSYFDPRVKGYKLFAGVQAPIDTSPATATDAGAKNRRGQRKRTGRAAKTPVAKWSSYIPLSGKAMVLANDVLFVAGNPAYFPPDHQVEDYQAGYDGRLGGVLWAASAADGQKQAEYKLQASPVWDGMAAANGRLYISLQDGTIVCLAGR